MTNMSNTPNAKHPPIEGITQDEIRSVLRSAVGSGNLGLEEVIRILDCDAARGDALLRAMAAAGYIEPDAVRGQLLYWRRTSIGNRLAMEKKRNRISPEKVQSTISEVVARAREINSDGDRLQRITLKLFGSALEARADYGDVDISIAFHRRKLSDEERGRIEAALCSRQSEYERQTLLGALMGAERQDSREIRAALKKSLPQLSLMRDDPMELGAPFRWLIDHDLEVDEPVEVMEGIVRPNGPSTAVQNAPSALPPVTLIKALHRELSPTTKISVEGLHIGLEDVPRLDEAMWSPRITGDGELVANDARDDPRIRFAGFQHLCQIWKEPIGGVLMLKRALEWCDQNKVWVRDIAPFVSISRGSGFNVIRLGLSGELIYFEVGTSVQKGSLMPINRTRVSKIDLAGTYTVARALAKMYVEARSAKVKACRAVMFLPSVNCDCLPDFPALARAGAFREGAFPGLLEASLTV
jgi:hypothetical protein